MTRHRTARIAKYYASSEPLELELSMSEEDALYRLKTEEDAGIKTVFRGDVPGAIGPVGSHLEKRGLAMRLRRFTVTVFGLTQNGRRRAQLILEQENKKNPNRKK